MDDFNDAIVFWEGLRHQYQPNAFGQGQQFRKKRPKRTKGVVSVKFKITRGLMLLILLVTYESIIIYGQGQEYFDCLALLRHV